MKEKIYEYLKSVVSKKEEAKARSRKYTLTLLIFFAATLICVAPPVVSVYFLSQAPLVILSGEAWVTVISMIAGFYFGANVVQKRLVKNEEISVSEILSKIDEAIPEQEKPDEEEQH